MSHVTNAIQPKPSSRLSEFWGGVQAEAPILLGTMPFGVIYGVVGRNAGLPPELVMAMSSVVFAGSAQMIAANLMAAFTPGIMVVLTTLVVNLRHALYSASVAPYVVHLRPLWKVLLAYLLTDEAYAVGIAHYLKTDEEEQPSPYRHWHLFGAALLLWSTWQLSTALGVYVLANALQNNAILNFTLPLTFIALTIPVLKDFPAILAAISAGLTATLASPLPHKLGLMLAAIIGITVGVLAEAWREQQRLKEDHSIFP